MIRITVGQTLTKTGSFGSHSVKKHYRLHYVKIYDFNIQLSERLHLRLFK
jgi:hypothetical protein